MDSYRQAFTKLQARYQLKWPNELIDSFLGTIEDKLTIDEFERSIDLCMRKESFFPAFDWFIETIHGTPEQQAQQKRLAAEVTTIQGDIVKTEGWHTERLKAKVCVGRSLRNPELITQAKLEAVDLGISLSVIGVTENEEMEMISKANAEARHVPDQVEAGNVTLHRVGAIAAKGMVDALF